MKTTNHSKSSNAIDDSKLLRKVLSSYATGVAVITTEINNVPIGMTVNSFASVSLDPPLVLWSIRNSSGLAEIFLNTKKWGVNVLNGLQKDLAMRFSSSEEDKFNNLNWHYSENGVPLLRDSAAFLECELHNSVISGDHTILVGEVKSINHQSASSLVFLKGEFLEIN